MSIVQSFFEALESLNGNKLRSGLTVLGIVIGVAAVIAMLAVGNGAQASITGSISSIGTNLLFVFSGSADGPTDADRSSMPADAGAARDVAFASVARQIAVGKNVMVLRNGWFSYRWTQIFDLGDIPW